jgi:predicted ATPase/DNA-binding SARP family transcriptional activator
MHASPVLVHHSAGPTVAAGAIRSTSACHPWLRLGEMSGPRFGILGPVRVTLGEAELHVGGPRETKALATLLLSPGQVITVPRLTQVLWDDEAPATAKAQVHNTIARLRRHLPDLITRSGPGYVIHVADEACDATVFQARVAAGVALADRGELDAAADQLRGALALWRGPALDGLDCTGLTGAAQRLDEQRLACLERRIELDLALGRHAALTGELAALVHEHPLRERLVELYLLALYRAGRRLEALDAFHETRDRLAEQTGLDPRPELDRLHRAILSNDPALDLARPLPGPRRRVLHRFIGRERQLAELPLLIKEHSVVTLTGPPGAGKTRLALELASSYADGVAVVALDMVPDEARIAAAILAVVDPDADPLCSPQENLVRRLADRDALLVLDNCEHVVGACARLLETLTAECPLLRVLTTSQLPLGLPNERAYAVQPLTVPLDDTVAAVEESESGRMLADRAARADPHFVLNDDNAVHLAHVCRAVEGLPLALELAGARLRAFSIGQIAARLDRQLELLAGRREPTRHRSLRAAIDWSHELLSGLERQVFARLSVFLGEFTLDDAEAVVADDQLSRAAVMDALGALVERSLVEHRPERYHLLRALREYAGQRLDERGEAATIQERHARYYCTQAETANRERRGPDRARWLRWLGSQDANLRAGMAWAHSSGAPELSLRYAAALTWHWRRFATREALDWLGTALPATTGAPADLRQRALIGAASVALRVSIDAARDYIRQAADLAHARSDRRIEVEALSFMASAEVYLADADAVRRYGDEAVALARAEGDPYLLARTLMARALTRAHVGDVQRTSQDLTEALALFERLGDRLGMDEVRMARAEAAFVSSDMAATRTALASIDLSGVPTIGTAVCWLCHCWLALREDRLGDAHAHLRRAVGGVTGHLTGPYAAQRIFGPALDLAAGLAFAEGDPARATTLLHAATAVLTLRGTVPERPQVRWVKAAGERTREMLDPATYAAAAERGTRMRLVDALAFANLSLPHIP